MKKLFSLVLAGALLGAFGANVHAKTVIEELIEFKTMKNNHMAAWITFASDLHTKKMNMIKKHMQEWTDFGNKLMQPLVKDASGVANLFTEKLVRDMIALEKKQGGEWRKFNEDEQKEIKKLAEKNEKELATFEKNLSGK